MRFCLRAFDIMCSWLWWLPGVPPLWTFVANRTKDVWS